MIRLAILAALLGAPAMGQPVALTHAQQREVIAINQDVNHTMPHFIRGYGQCVPIAEEKQRRLAAIGIPATIRIVRADPRLYNATRHEVLDLDATIDGKPWRVSLDMNSPWPNTAEDEARMGYAPAN